MPTGANQSDVAETRRRQGRDSKIQRIEIVDDPGIAAHPGNVYHDCYNENEDQQLEMLKITSSWMRTNFDCLRRLLIM